jgi:hypothetical protein
MTADDVISVRLYGGAACCLIACSVTMAGSTWELCMMMVAGCTA